MTNTHSLSDSAVGSQTNSNHSYEITIIGVLFFIFGFVTWINGSLIAYLKIACQLTTLQAFFVAFAFFISYFVMGIPSAFVLKLTGYKNGMVLGLGIMALGAILFVPAAHSLIYGWFLTALFIIGTGLAILQAAVNPYVTILGPIESAAQRISIMGICNKVAGGIGTFVLGALLLVDTDKFTASIIHLNEASKKIKLHELASRAVVPYIVISIVLIVLALLVWLSKLPEVDTDHEDENLALANSSKTSVFQFPNLVLGVISLFLYVGVEVIAGDSIIIFGQSQHIPLDSARYFTIFTLLSMILGYILGIFLIPKYLKQDNALRISAILGLVLTLGIVFSHGSLAIAFLASLGFANAIMWPAMWPLALEGLGKFTKIGSALLIMAIAGGALIPLVLAKLFDVLPGKTQMAYIIAIPCYAFILYYASLGHKIKSWTR